MNPRSCKTAGTLAHLGRLLLFGSLLCLVGCSDGVERNSVQVPDRSGLAPGGGGVQAPSAKNKRPAPDSKVIVPGGKKA
jgi:hypothetical protein